jgi:hypothetical protein
MSAPVILGQAQIAALYALRASSVVFELEAADDNGVTVTSAAGFQWTIDRDGRTSRVEATA